MDNGARSVVIHGHFYQPPREDPWLEELPREASAAPYHDWNERIERECYRAVVAARLPAEGGTRIRSILNTLEHISFDFGPTLLEWLEFAAPQTYAAVIASDGASCEALAGHGNAMAMPYHHVILPLASRRDKVTEVRWGMEDFRIRFGREPEGMWLPETAVDDETLDVLAEEGIRFTVLAPHQVANASPDGSPGLYRTEAGRSIALFAYDGATSAEIGFGHLLKDASQWRERMTTEQVLTAVATDGETWGHHHTFGEMALAAVIDGLGSAPGIRVENFASFLARHPAEHEVELRAPSAWSCVHGVERWRSDCGCKAHPEIVSNQEWRTGLRDSLDWLAAELQVVFADEGARFFDDPRAARDEYGRALVRGPEATNDFFNALVCHGDDERLRAAELLEMERNALRMFTSCGWFFDDVAGLEGRQILRYAARAIELSGSHEKRLADGLRERLASASSNDPAVGTARDLFDAVLPQYPPQAVAAAAFRAITEFAPGREHTLPRAFAASETDGRITVTCRRTGASAVFECSAGRDVPGGIAVTVREMETGSSHVIGASDLPRRVREAVSRSARAGIIQRTFTRDALRDLAEGEGLKTVAARVLEGAVHDLVSGPDPDSVQRVQELLTLHDLLDVPFPFDAQTTFYRMWRDRRGSDQELESLAHRLGFV